MQAHTPSLRVHPTHLGGPYYSLLSQRTGWPQIGTCFWGLLSAEQGVELLFQEIPTVKGSDRAIDSGEPVLLNLASLAQIYLTHHHIVSIKQPYILTILFF